MYPPRFHLFSFGQRLVGICPHFPLQMKPQQNKSHLERLCLVIQGSKFRREKNFASANFQNKGLIGLGNSSVTTMKDRQAHMAFCVNTDSDTIIFLLQLNLYAKIFSFC